jgi:hypothetical protein
MRLKTELYAEEQKQIREELIELLKLRWFRKTTI